MLHFVLLMSNATRSAVLNQDDAMAILQSACLQPRVKVSHVAGSV